MDIVKQYLFGVDLGGTSTKIGLFSTSGTLIEKWEIVTLTENKGKDILINIAELINEKMLDKHISIDGVSGIGLGVPGAVIKDCYVEKGVNLNGWDSFNVAVELSQMCDNLPVIVLNDANAVALGEMWQKGMEI